mgnify:CR=1 FL=1
MSTKHTPGPWQRHNNGNDLNPDWQVLDNEGRVLIAETYWSRIEPHVSPEHSEANAKLIAAAPELLAALVSLYTKFKGEGLDVDECYGPIMKQAREAIRKATE